MIPRTRGWPGLSRLEPGKRVYENNRKRVVIAAFPLGSTLLTPISLAITPMWSHGTIPDLLSNDQ